MSTHVRSRSVPHGRGLLKDPHYSQGAAFTAEERTALGLEGLLPAGVSSLEEQAQRSYEQYRAQPDDLARNTFLAAPHDRNEVLYYRLLQEHLKEILPVVYDYVIHISIAGTTTSGESPPGDDLHE
jgi:malate dehydrogenase (oxaloacetate-decarboxylating)